MVAQFRSADVGTRASGWPSYLLTAVASAGGLIAMPSGLVLLQGRWQPDTGHGEDIGRPFGIIAFSLLLFLGVSLALGAGIGAIALRRQGRRISVVAVALGAGGLACGLIAWLA
jgi:hypothetical protein